MNVEIEHSINDLVFFINDGKIIDANEKVVADYKGGKENALMSLVGQIMKETKGSANPAVAKQVLLDLLK